MTDSGSGNRKQKVSSTRVVKKATRVVYYSISTRVLEAALLGLKS